MSKNALCSWDFSCGTKFIEFPILKDWLKENCKKWCFQEETGEETGYIHYQGRVSLKVKSRFPDKPCKEISWSPTSTENSDNDFYACKKATRTNGPWKDTDEEIYIPRQVREITKLHPWQQKVIDKSNVWDTRSINLIIDNTGNGGEGGCNGKSTLKTYMRCHKLGRVLPFCNDYKDLMRMCYDMPTSKCYLIDMPRAINKEKLFQFFAGVESIKDGYCYDDRYTFREKMFDCPNIWIFTNRFPPVGLLSKDRWKLWGIDSDLKLFKRNFEEDKDEGRFEKEERET